MFRYVYEWVQNLSFYLVISSAIIQVIPGEEYKKYLRFFTGIVMILLLMTPILKLTGTEQSFAALYHSPEYERKKGELQSYGRFLEEQNYWGFLPEQMTEGTTEGKDRRIEVEAITVGR